jgi:hypothetical protein
MFEFVQSQEKNEAFLPFQDVISYDNGKMILEISELINLDSFQEKTFTFYIPLSHTIKEIKNLEFDSAVILNAEIIQVNQSYALKMVCHFPPNAETQLARALYSLGVQQISMKGKMVSILDFARYYHAMEKNHFQKNRNAIKN